MFLTSAIGGDGWSDLRPQGKEPRTRIEREISWAPLSARTLWKRGNFATPRWLPEP
jgi:hypothetical protein